MPTSDHQYCNLVTCSYKWVHVWTRHKPHCNQARTHFFIYFLGQAIRLAHFLLPDLCPCPPKREKEKAKEQKQCLQVKAPDFLWKLDFLFWSLHDSLFEVVGVFKLSVGSIFFGLWLFPLVLWCFFSPRLSLSSVLVLFSAFSFLMSVYEYLRGNRGCLLGSEDEDGKNGELSRDAFICHTNPTAVWTHSFMKRGRKERGTGEKDGRGEECGALLIKGCCQSVFWSRDNSHKLSVLSNLLSYYIKDSLN